EPVPVCRFLFELPAAEPGEGIELGTAVVLARSPFGGDPAFLLELVQSRIERSVTDLKHLAGNLLETLADGPAVQGLQGNDLEDQQVQGSLDQIGRLAHRYSSRLPMLDGK